MATKSWAVSLFLAWHVLAISLGSFDPSDDAPAVRRSPETTGPLASFLDPWLDRAAALVEPVFQSISEAARPVRQATAAYLQLMGIEQDWRMFVEPFGEQRYLRLRYYVGRENKAGDPAWAATELVLPANREDEVRMVRGYWNHFRDRAILSSLNRFRRSLNNRVGGPETTSAQLPDDLAPIARYFARRYQEEALGPDEHILRTEVWFGLAPMTVKGAANDRVTSSARLTALREYYQGPVEDLFPRFPYPTYRSAEQEADIVWVLEYFEP